MLIALENKKKQNETPATSSDNVHHILLKRPIELDADVVRFQNNKEKWIAFVGLMDGRPYEIFTGLNLGSVDLMPGCRLAGIFSKRVQRPFSKC